MPSEWYTAAEAAERLGIQLPTLYAYVSRGQLVSHPIPGAHRGSRYLDRDRPAGRPVARPRGAAGFSVVVDSSLTLLDPAGKLYYRGWDVEAACREASYERVAEWLWTGVDAGEPAVWTATEAGSAAVARATADLRRRRRWSTACGSASRSSRSPTRCATTGDPRRSRPSAAG